MFNERLVRQRSAKVWRFVKVRNFPGRYDAELTSQDLGYALQFGIKVQY